MRFSEAKVLRLSEVSMLERTTLVQKIYEVDFALRGMARSLEWMSTSIGGRSSSLVGTRPRAEPFPLLADGSEVCSLGSRQRSVWEQTLLCGGLQSEQVGHAQPPAACADVQDVLWKRSGPCSPHRILPVKTFPLLAGR